MSIISQLATSLNRRDEKPNQDLAKKIVQTNNTIAVKEVIKNLKNSDKNIQADCIEVTNEIGALQPLLLKKYIPDIAALVESKNNRLVWGAMITLKFIAHTNLALIYNLLPSFIDAANNGSVITRDNLVSILIRLESDKKYKGDIFPLVLEQLVSAPTNQLPMYAEYCIPVVNETNKDPFIKILQDRLKEVESETKKKRILKVIKKVNG